MKTLSTANRKRVKCVKMPPTKKRRNVRDNQRSHPRKLMRDWLEQLLNDGLCRGLRWMDKPNGKFTVDWCHGSRGGFNPSHHSEVFYRWAEHTGKIERGSGKDPSSNKSAFRCALHSLKDCIDLTQEGDNRGESAKRIFQFIEPGHPEYGSKKRTGCSKKNMIEAKEETVATDEQDSWAPDTEHVTIDQDTNTLESQDTQPETSKWLYPPIVASTSGAFPSFQLPVEKTDVNSIDVDGDSFIAQKPVSSASSPAALHAAADTTTSFGFVVVERCRLVSNFDDLSLSCPGNNTHLVETQSNGVVTLELQEIDVDGENIQMDTVDDSKLPVFAKLGMSDTVPFAHLGLNSGGSVKVRKSKQKSWRTSEFRIKQTPLDHTPLATVPDRDDTNSADTGYGSFGNDSVDMIERMIMNNSVQIEGFENRSLDEIITELQHSPLAEENNVDLANFVFSEMNENPEIEVLLLDHKQTDHIPDDKALDEVFFNTPFILDHIFNE